jgi:hypothetical protein
MFKGLTKLLVCGGFIGVEDCEVIDLESSNTTCKNPPTFPAGVSGAIGGLGFKENPIICGGLQNTDDSNRCYSLENNEWVSSVDLNSVRVYGAEAQLQDGHILVTGGRNGSAYLNSAEMLTEEGWESKIPSLPVSVSAHCMVTVNSTTVMAIGGYQDGKDYSGKTFYYTFGEESWTAGPQLMNKRGYSSCGKIRRDKLSRQFSIIVVGGYDGNSILKSVEILAEGSNSWKSGPELPMGMEESKIVEGSNGGVVLIGGKSISVTYLDTLYQLQHGGLDAVWTKMEQKLNTGRYRHLAILVPDSIVDCS